VGERHAGAPAIRAETMLRVDAREVKNFNHSINPGKLAMRPSLNTLSVQSAGAMIAE
jgi:hypothetical protein